MLRLFTSWEAAHGLPPARVQPGQELRRTCGCLIDPIVFGHYWCATRAGAA